jgi:hypothetical protein
MVKLNLIACVALVLLCITAVADVECNKDCKVFSCAQIGAVAGGFNCRIVAGGDILVTCSPDVYHIDAGSGICTILPTTFIDVNECKECNPECDEIPNKATQCETDCRNYPGMWNRRICASSSM